MTLARALSILGAHSFSLFSNVRPAHSGQAATPAAAAVNDNATQALTAGVGKPFPLGGDPRDPVCILTGNADGAGKSRAARGDQSCL